VTAHDVALIDWDESHVDIPDLDRIAAPLGSLSSKRQAQDIHLTPASLRMHTRER
jgi:hypothetical protein